MKNRRLAALALTGCLAVAAGPVFAQSRATDRDDLAVLLPTINNALETAPSGSPVTWFNPATGNRGEVEVLRTFYRADDIPCRDYKRTTEHADRSARLVQGTGCRIEDGFWKLEESESRVIRPPSPVEDAKAPAVDETAAAEPRPSPSQPKPLPSKPGDIATPREKPAAPIAEAKAPDPAPAPEVSAPPEIVARLPQPAVE